VRKRVYGFLVRIARDPELLIGIDLSEPYLKGCKFHKVYDDVILASVLFLPFKSKGVDVVLASEIIEHLPKNDGKRFFDEIDRVCKERAIITTPNIHVATSTRGLDAHKSHYSQKELKSRGYKVYGIGAKIDIAYTIRPTIIAAI
jgi:2-polyprenyl-3-methyl-5-hydroxy-6-metoxy-1,4-benzoquinol methylase